METTAHQMNDLQKVELELLRHFLQICQKLELQYYIVGGTLLGAVRHKGFIPWDDDVDIAMPRADYERFLKHAQPLLPAHVFLQTHRTDPEYPANFAKLRDSRTTFIETSVRHRSINHGVYIDIFPLDHFPDGKWDAFRLYWKNYFLAGRIAADYYYSEPLPLRSRLKQAVCRLLHPSLEKALEDREKLIKSVPASSRIINHSGAWGKKELMPAAWFGAGCPQQFEGITALGVLEYDKMLTHVYGSYMELPPVEKRVGHHYADVIDLTKPYTAYRNK